MGIDKNIIEDYFSELSSSEQNSLLKDLSKIKIDSDCTSILGLRGDALDDRRAECPHCESASYHKNGVDKGSRRYRCNDCSRTFTEYTGTWIAGMHKKEQISGFLKALEMNLSLKRSARETGLDEGTIFIWRHKFLSAHQNISDPKSFKGVTESDESYYLHSQKGKKCKQRPPRFRGGRPTAGLSKNEAVLLTTMDREGNRCYAFAAMGRVTKKDLEHFIGDRISYRTILCTDGLASYKSFSEDHSIEHHAMLASKGERVKGEYHIQSVNNVHGKMKTLYNGILRGVSTKYLQKYANWQKIRDVYKEATIWTKAVLAASMLRVDALRVYNNTEQDYLDIYSPTLFSS
jgi:transposase-like protein